jgi:hypothetical protein
MLKGDGAAQAGSLHYIAGPEGFACRMRAGPGTGTWLSEPYVLEGRGGVSWQLALHGRPVTRCTKLVFARPALINRQAVIEVGMLESF